MFTLPGGTIVMSVLLALAGPFLEFAQGRQNVAPPTAAVRIASVTPKSVNAGASFTVAVELPDGFDASIILGVHRLGLNFEQYRSLALRDGDQLDGAPDVRGVILHRIATDAKWTSAQSLVRKPNASDRYMVIVQDPAVLQVDQTLTVLGSALTVDAGVVRGLFDNVEKGLRVSEILRSRTAAREPWASKMYDLSATQAVRADPDGGTYFVKGSTPTKTADSMYMHRKDFLWGLPDDASADYKARMMLSGNDPATLFEWTSAIHAQEIKNELLALRSAVQSLPPDAQTAVAAQLQQLENRANLVGFPR